jgi:hypothetical protein
MPLKYQRDGAKSISIRMWNISQKLKRTFSLCLSRRDLRMDSRQALRACALGVSVWWAMAVGNRLGASLFGVLPPTVCAATIQIAHGRRTTESKFGHRHALPTFIRLSGAEKPDLSADLK